MEILDDIFNIVCFLIELCIYNSDGLVWHLFNSAIVRFTMNALFDLLALLNDIFENCLFLLGVRLGLILMNEL